MEYERQSGPSTYILSFSGIIAVAGLFAAGVASYNALENDIASLKRDKLLQQQINHHLLNDIRFLKTEQLQELRSFNEKLKLISDSFATQTERKSCEWTK